MNNQKSKTEKLNQFGRQLLESARVQDEEIERIIAAPQLFNLVKTRVEEQKRTKQTKSDFFAVLNWQRVGFSFGVLAILVVCSFGLSFFVYWNSSLKFETAGITVQEIQIPNSMVEDLSAFLGTDERGLERRAGIKKEPVNLPKSGVKSNKRQLHPVVEEEQEFYPVTFVGDLEDMRAEAQIVRVELSRSSLIALGVNPPTENVAEKIKTELLIGSDGVTRGIRFVK